MKSLFVIIHRVVSARQFGSFFPKPTIINILFAIFLLGGKIIFKKNFLELFLKNSIKLENIGWDKLYLDGYFFLFF